MEKTKQPGQPIEIPVPDKHEEIIIPINPEEPINIPQELPNITPEGEPFVTPPFEMPPAPGSSL